MKKFILFFVTIVFSVVLNAEFMGNKLIRGVVKSFDKSNVVIEVEDIKVKVQRSLVAKETKLKTGMILEVELTEEQFKNLKTVN